MELHRDMGHHRIAAAIKSGIKKADVFVGDLDDKAMIRVYARENATQRGNHATAAAGSVAAAVRFLFKEQSLTLEFQSGKRGGAARDGIGAPTVLAFLKDVPGVTSNTVQEQLANLKKSGNYARILEEVQVEVDEILRAEQEAIAKAQAPSALEIRSSSKHAPTSASPAMQQPRLPTADFAGYSTLLDDPVSD